MNVQSTPLNEYHLIYYYLFCYCSHLCNRSGGLKSTFIFIWQWFWVLFWRTTFVQGIAQHCNNIITFHSSSIFSILDPFSGDPFISTKDKFKVSSFSIQDHWPTNEVSNRGCFFDGKEIMLLPKKLKTNKKEERIRDNNRPWRISLRNKFTLRRNSSPLSCGE